MVKKNINQKTTLVIVTKKNFNHKEKQSKI